MVENSGQSNVIKRSESFTRSRLTKEKTKKKTEKCLKSDDRHELEISQKR